MKVILIRFGELTLKGKNRKEFERILYNNLTKQLKSYDLVFRKDRNRIYINIEDVTKFDEITEVIKKVPGIMSFSIADICENNVDAIKQVALDNFDRTNPIFKVNTKRSNKDFPLTSQELSRQVGGHILFNNDGLENMKVDVKNPKQEINIEIQRDNAYVFHKKIMGMGGLPIGTAGRAVVLLSGGIDSPVAAIQAMKRGLKITCLHFSSPPYTSDEALNKVLDLIAVLQEYDRDIKFFDCNFSDLQLAIHQECMDKYEVTILRRMMLRQAKVLADRLKAQVIITGESLGQVASQTIEGMYVSDNTVDTLILRPLIAMDKSEIIILSKKYQTYDISIRPFEDCCTIFVPKNPATKPKLEEVVKEENRLDYMTYINNAQVDQYTFEDINEKNNSLLTELF